MRRSLSDFVVSSNFGFVLPLTVTLIKPDNSHSIFILLVMTFSVLHHSTKEQKWIPADILAASLLIGYNLYVFSLSGFRSPNFFGSLVFVTIGFYYLKRRGSYSFNHGVWHLASVVITTLAALSPIG